MKYQDMKKGDEIRVLNPKLVPDKYYFDGQNLTVTFPIKLTEPESYQKVNETL